MQVIIPLPRGHRDKTFLCYRLTEIDGKIIKEFIPGEQTEDSYIIYLEHFSMYALVADGGEEEHTHVFGDYWKFDGNSHWHECECGEKTEFTRHIAGEWKEDSAAKVRYRDCTVCGARIDTVLIDVNGDNNDPALGAPCGLTDPNFPAILLIVSLGVYITIFVRKKGKKLFA